MAYRITSRTNPKVKDLVKHRSEHLFFEGDKLVNDILERQIPIEILIINEAEEDRCILPEKTKIKDTWLVNESVMDKLSTLKESPYLIAVVKPEQERINFRKSRCVLALDTLQDPANGGTVFRCAAAFGIDSIAFCGPSVKPENPKFLRAAQNAFFDVNFQHFESAETLIKKATTAGMNIYLTSSHSPKKTIGMEKVRFPCLIMLGNEGQGLPEELLYQYPSIKIDQSDKVESLNVGVSACIIMHEIKRLRDMGHG